MNKLFENVSEYRDVGYSYVEQLIPKELVIAVRTCIVEHLEKHPDWKHAWQLLDPEVYTNSKGQTMPYFLQRPGMYDETFKKIVEHPRLIQKMEELLGGKVKFFTDQVGIKYGDINNDQGGRSYYHQDAYYWNIPPQRGANVWIPLDTVAKDQIALAVMPGSQKNGVIEEHEQYFDNPNSGHYIENQWKPFKRHRIPSKNTEFAKETLLPMNPGDGLFFSNHTWHRSEPNRSGVTKMFYAIAYELLD